MNNAGGAVPTHPEAQIPRLGSAGLQAVFPKSSPGGATVEKGPLTGASKAFLPLSGVSTPGKSAQRHNGLPLG